MIAANCCVTEFEIIVTDVAGNYQTMKAYRKGSVLPLIKATFLGIGIMILVALLIAFIVYLCRNKRKYGHYILRSRKANPPTMKRRDAVHEKTGIDEIVTGSMLTRGRKDPPYENTINIIDDNN